MNLVQMSLKSAKQILAHGGRRGSLISAIPVTPSFRISNFVGPRRLPEEGMVEINMGMHYEPPPARQISDMTIYTATAWCLHVYDNVMPYFLNRQSSEVKSLEIFITCTPITSEYYEIGCTCKAYDGTCTIYIDLATIKDTVYLTSVFLHELAHLLVEKESYDLCTMDKNGPPIKTGHCPKWWATNASLVAIVQYMFPSLGLEAMDVSQFG